MFSQPRSSAILVLMQAPFVKLVRESRGAGGVRWAAQPVRVDKLQAALARHIPTCTPDPPARAATARGCPHAPLPWPPGRAAQARLSFRWLALEVMMQSAGCQKAELKGMPI